MNTIKAVLFDFDGTLADTLPYYIKAYDIALRACGLVKSEKEIFKSCFGKTVDDTCIHLEIPEKVEQFSETFFTAVKTLFKSAKLFDSTIETLQHMMANNYRLAIITFAYRWYIDQMMMQFNLDKYIEIVISANDVIYPKPHPEAILKICTSFGINPKEAMVVGDSKSDILMAKAAGSNSVLMHPSSYELFYSLDELKKTNPDFIIQDISELNKITIL